MAATLQKDINKYSNIQDEAKRKISLKADALLLKTSYIHNSCGVGSDSKQALQETYFSMYRNINDVDELTPYHYRTKAGIKETTVGEYVNDRCGNQSHKIEDASGKFGKSMQKNVKELTKEAVKEVERSYGLE